jgi:hypothetical protein
MSEQLEKTLMLDRDFFRLFEPRDWHEWLEQQEAIERRERAREARARGTARRMEDEW